MHTVLLIYRASQFSPNCVEKDKAILEAVGRCLQMRDCEVDFVQETDLTDEHEADAYLSMGRLPRTLAILKRKASQGRLTLNSGEGVERMARSTLDRLMRQEGIPVAPLYDGRDTGGCWLKRGDAAAQERGDVLFAGSRQEMDEGLAAFHRRGVTDVLITEHVPGDLVKFYGVQGTRFFRCFYPTDDGDTKFGDERHNGAARHYAFPQDCLRRDAERLSEMTDVRIYGGDCIVRADGSYAIIDFNDWPSFSRCRDEAAAVIADRAVWLFSLHPPLSTLSPSTKVEPAELKQTKNKRK